MHYNYISGCDNISIIVIGNTIITSISNIYLSVVLVLLRQNKKEPTLVFSTANIVTCFYPK
ncbi:predicted protein [Listeria monocytogenes FSL J2-071]|nr:predicted protein [Listeria monocytogenes FSL J2-071]